jgi:tellurite resistance protein
MHIVLGVLTSIVTILYLLDRMGIDIGWWNPFYWRRRRAFARKLGSDPIYSIEDPLHLASLFVIGTAKLDGELTAESKRVAQEQFETSFSMSTKESSELFSSAAHLLAAPQLLDNQLDNLVEQNKHSFSPEQAESMIDMAVAVASADGEASAAQRAFVEKMRSSFALPRAQGGTWS